MVASEGSFLGLSRQARQGTAITDDTLFKYMLFTEGAMGAQNITLPLDPEVGGGALSRQILKVGVSGMGTVRFIPRPETIGFALYGVTGRVSSRKNFVQLWNAAKSCDGSKVVAFDRKPASATKIFVISSTGGVGGFLVNDGGAPTETITLTGNSESAGALTFKTVTRIDYPRGTGTMRLYDAAGNPLKAAKTLSAAAPQRDVGGISNPAPASTVKIRTDATVTAFGPVKVYGTDAGDLTIFEEIYVYPYEKVESSNTYSSTLLDITSPISAGDTYNVYYHDGSYTHDFFLDYWDQFDAPYYTARSAPGNLWGEQLIDARFNVLSLDFAAANFLRGALGWTGITPSKTADTEWEPSSYLDSGPQFVSALGAVELPDGTALSVLSGSFAAVSNIPLDQQFVIGSYYPNGMDIVAKGFLVNYAVKISDAGLYAKMMYDPAYTSGAAAWVAEIYREGRLDMFFRSDQDACSIKPTVAESGMPAVTGDYRPYRLTFAANAQTGDSANMQWFAQPVPLQAQRQLILGVTGQFLANPTAAQEPITISLINRRASY